MIFCEWRKIKNDLKVRQFIYIKDAWLSKNPKMYDNKINISCIIRKDMTSTGFINAVEYYERPSGSLLMGADNYHNPFKKREHNIFKKHHPSVYH